jgi:hypothetical protein
LSSVRAFWGKARLTYSTAGMAAWESLSGFVAGADGGGGGLMYMVSSGGCQSESNGWMIVVLSRFVRCGDLFFVKGFAATSLVKQIDELLLSGPVWHLMVADDVDCQTASQPVALDG